MGTSMLALAALAGACGDQVEITQPAAVWPVLEDAESFVRVPDGIVVAGWSRAPDDLKLTAYDDDGGLRWQTGLGIVGRRPQLELAPDGGVIVMATLVEPVDWQTYVVPEWPVGVAVARLAADGTIIWKGEQRLPPPDGLYSEWLYPEPVAVAADGSVVVGGRFGGAATFDGIEYTPGEGRSPTGFLYNHLESDGILVRFSAAGEAAGVEVFADDADDVVAALRYRDDGTLVVVTQGALPSEPNCPACSDDARRVRVWHEATAGAAVLAANLDDSGVVNAADWNAAIDAAGGVYHARQPQGIDPSAEDGVFHSFEMELRRLGTDGALLWRRDYSGIWLITSFAADGDRAVFALSASPDGHIDEADPDFTESLYASLRVVDADTSDRALWLGAARDGLFRDLSIEPDGTIWGLMQHFSSTQAPEMMRF